MTAFSLLDSRVSWTRLAVTLGVASVGNAGIWMIVMVMPAVQDTFAVGRAAASLPYTATMVGFALGNLLLGRAVDRWGISAVLLFAAGCIVAGYGLATLAGSIAVLAACHVLLGFGNAICFAPLLADISHWFLRRRGIAVAVAASGNYLSGAIWPVALSGMLASQGWTAVYWTMAALTLLTLVPGAMALRPRLPPAAHVDADARAAERRARGGLSPGALQGLLIVAGLGCCLAMSMPQVHIVAYCVDLGYGPAVGAGMLSVMLMGGVVSRLASGFLADWLGGVPTLLIGSSLQCIALFLYLPANGMVSLYIVSLVFGLSQGGIVPSYAVIVREYLPAREAGARVGAVIFATIVGMALGGWMAGWIFTMTGSYQMAFVHGIAWNVLNIGIMVLIVTAGRRKRRRGYA